MRSDVALFFTTIAAIAIVGIIVQQHSNSAAVIRSTGNALSSVYGTAITGNPQFYQNARGLA